MPVRTVSAVSARRFCAGLSVALFAGLALAPAQAADWPEERGPTLRRVHRHPEPQPAEGRHVFPQDGIVSGYLPRNNNLPMYNEPPRRGPSW